MLRECILCSVLYTSLVLAEDTSTKDPTEYYIPCERGWFYFKDKCYRLGGKKRTGRLSWDKALEKCKEDGGNLATVDSMELNDFLLKFLVLDAQIHAFIGLNDKKEEGVYVWQDGNPSDFRNWEPGGPQGPDYEDCFEMLFISLRKNGQTGQWNDISCSDERAYICETSKKRNIKSPDPRFCPGTGGAWKYQNSCFSLISEKMSWKRAEEYCQTHFQGHLAMITDWTVDMFLDYILSTFDKEIWIGIKIREQHQQKWTSGWYVSYNDWAKDHGEFVEGTCAVRSKPRLWTTRPCSKKYPFVCERSLVSPPVLPPPTKGTHCPNVPQDWKDLGGDYCYYFETTREVSWNQANFECMRRGGSLVSIHSAAESAVLHPFVKYTKSRLFIGLYRLAGYEDVFVWSDGSRLDYLNWNADSGEPSSQYELCSELWTISMTWNDIKCDSYNSGYICSVRKLSSNNTEITSETNCPTGVSLKAFIGVGVCILLLVALLVFVIYRLKPCDADERRKMSNTSPPVPSTQRPRYRSGEIVIKEETEYYEHMA